MRKTMFALALLLLTGCGRNGGLPYAREMGDMALLRTMSVDAGEKEPYSVTISTGRRARGLQKEAENPLILSAESRSMSGACTAMEGLSDQYVFYGYVDQLLLGQALAEQGIRPVLEYFARDMELGMGAQVWMVEGKSADLIYAAEEEGIDERLSILHTDSEMGVASVTRTVGEVLTSILENGGSYLPALTQTEGGLAEAGYGILKGELLVGVLSGNGAKGLELLEGRSHVGVIDGHLSGRQDALRVADVITVFRPVYEGERLVGVEVYCRVTADLTEFSSPLADDAVEELTGQLEETLAGWMEEALHTMQGWNADGIGILGKLGRAEPQRWAALQQQWERALPALRWQVEVDGTVRRTFGAVAQD